MMGQVKVKEHEELYSEGYVHVEQTGMDLIIIKYVSKQLLPEQRS